jgi:hypothetical protein
VGVMAFLKGTKNWSGVFPKLKVAMAFLKYAKIAVASIQLTLYLILPLIRKECQIV